MSKPTVFVTGATGLVGSHLVRLLLRRGFKHIKALRRPQSDLSLLGDDIDAITWIDGDMLDVEALTEGCRGAEWVFHCAGLISYDPADRDKLFAINVEGTANIVNAALHTGVKKLLHLSSVSVLSRTGLRQVVTEETPWQPTAFTSTYGLTKHLAEREVQRGIAEGLTASMIIPSIILGAGNWHSGSATIFHQIGKGMPVYPPGQNGYVDVRDVALMAILAMEQESTCRIIASGHTIGYKELFTEIALRLKKRPPSITIGRTLSEVVWRLFMPVKWVTGRVSVINKETTRASQSFPEYDNSASLQIPGFKYSDLPRTLDDIAVKYLEAREKKFKPLFLDFAPHHLL
jgi:nucleoside-diphosphate-sugar epimerase